MKSDTAQPYPHYFRQLPPGCTHIDVYRVLELFGVTSPALAHAVKKLLCAGERGSKDQAQDIAEAIATLQRWQQMRQEEQPAPAAAHEDAERAARLERWRDAPEWAQWLSQDLDGRCDFWEVKPTLYEFEEEWSASDGEPTHTDRRTDDNLIGSVNCEPRPVPADGQSWDFQGIKYTRGPRATP